MNAKELIDACGGDSNNLRWFLYCVANGNQPALQRKIDQAKWPGDELTGFLDWLNGHSADFLRDNPLRPPETLYEHRDRLNVHLAEAALRSYEAVLKQRDEVSEPIECVENAP